MIDRELLKRAWPEGYLMMRGVKTIGGWTLRAVIEETDISTGLMVWDLPSRERGEGNSSQTLFPCEPALISFHEGQRLEPERNKGDLAAALTETRWMTALEAGDLLPNVDPSDVATWACLLHELADVADIEGRVNLTWRRIGKEMSMPQSGWILASDPFDMTASLRQLLGAGGIGGDGLKERMGRGLKDLAEKIKRRGQLFEVAAEDPAEALVHARISYNA